MASLFELLGNVNWSDLEGKKARESGIFEYSTSKVEIIMMVREMNKRLQVGLNLNAFLTMSPADVYRHNKAVWKF